MTQTLKDDIINQRYREYRENKALKNLEQAELERQHNENKAAWQQLEQKHQNAITLHPVNTKKDYPCACCNNTIPQGSTCMSRRIKSTQRNKEWQPGDNYFVERYVTLHFCTKCETVRPVERTLLEC